MPEAKRQIACSVCGGKEALLFVKLADGQKTLEKGLCASCAMLYMDKKMQMGEGGAADKKLLETLEEMKKLLSSIVTDIKNIAFSTDAHDDMTILKCSNCGLTYEDFRTSGYLGCPYCYHAFAEQIGEIFFEVERGGFHKGKMPKSFARLYLFKKEIGFLKNQLKKSLSIENYEQADKIKKKLEKLIGNYPIGKEDEIY
jgi:protein arginine kinase activator